MIMKPDQPRDTLQFVIFQKEKLKKLYLLMKSSDELPFELLEEVENVLGKDYMKIIDDAKDRFVKDIKQEIYHLKEFEGFIEKKFEKISKYLDLCSKEVKRLKDKNFTIKTLFEYY